MVGRELTARPLLQKVKSRARPPARLWFCRLREYPCAMSGLTMNHDTDDGIARVQGVPGALCLSGYKSGLIWFHSDGTCWCALPQFEDEPTGLTLRQCQLPT